MGDDNPITRKIYIREIIKCSNMITMKKLMIFYVNILWMIILFIYIFCFVSARTITVDDDNPADYEKIQDSINASQDGDTILVFAGSYFEQITINKSVCLIGNGSEVTRIIGYGSGIGIAITSPSSNISGFNISTWNKGIFIAFVSGSNNIYNNTFYSSVIDLNSAHENKIFNNSFFSVKNSGVSGINLYNSKYNYLDNNTFINCGISIQGSKIEDWKTNYIEIDNRVNEKPIIFLKNVMNHNISSGAGQIIIANCSVISVENQNCSDGSVGISVAFSNNISISRNIGISNLNYNCYIVNSEDIRVTNNTFNMSFRGIFANNVRSSYIVSNVLSENSNAGLTAYQTEETVIQDNIYMGNKYGIRLESNKNCIISNNILVNNFNGIQIEFSGHCQIANNTISLNKEFGVHLTENSMNNMLISNNITGNTIGIFVSTFSMNNYATLNDISVNKDFGIEVADSNHFLIFAMNNWWGSPTGPYHPIKNKNGKGNEITNYVDFDPWTNRPFGFRHHYISPLGNDKNGTGSQDYPYRTIRKAIDIADEWDIIKILDGTYFENLVINKGLTIIGTSPSATVLDGRGNATAMVVQVGNVEISNLTIRNANGSGISITNSSGVRIIDCLLGYNILDLVVANSTDNQLVNTTFETLNLSDSVSNIIVGWTIDVKVLDNHSGFIQNAHFQITDRFNLSIFNGYTNQTGRIPQLLLLDYDQNLSSRSNFNPFTISIFTSGYLNYAKIINVTSYTRITCQLRTHIRPVAIISGDLVRIVDMDSQISFEGSLSRGRSITYFWEFGDGEFSVLPTPSHTYISPGAHQVNLTVTDDYDNTSSSYIIVVVNNVLPTALMNSDTISIIEDEEIFFDAFGSGDTSSDSISYLWDFGDGDQSHKDSVAHSYTEKGDYKVTLTVIDSYGSESSTFLYVTVSNEAPWDASAGGDKDVLTNSIVEFYGSAQDTFTDISDISYSWDFSDGKTALGRNVTHSYLKPGFYYVNLTVTDNNDAWESTMINVTVRNPYINWTIRDNLNSTWPIISQDTTLFFGAMHELDDGSFMYLWNFGNGFHDVGINVSHTFTNSGIFQPVLQVYDGLENTTVFLREYEVRNVHPHAVVDTNKRSPRLYNESELVRFDASNSSDSFSDIENLVYIWDFGDGTWGSGMQVTHVYINSGGYTVILTVRDGKDIDTAGVIINVQNLPPMADAGIKKDREAIVGNPVILDGSVSTDTPLDLIELNYTWKVGDDRIYGGIVSYLFETEGNFSVILEVRDNNGAVSNDTLTFGVSKSSKSDNKETISTASWILVAIIIVFMLIIGFLISAIRNEALYQEMKVEETLEETIVIEGEIDKESFKRQEDAQEVTIEGTEEQDVEIVEAEVEVVREGETDDSMFKPPNDIQKATEKISDEQDQKIADAGVEVGGEKDDENGRVAEEQEDITK